LKNREKVLILPKHNIERDILLEIVPWLNKNEIIIITGARQTGKTVLLKQIIHKYLIPKNRKYHYFNLDYAPDAEFLKDPDNVIELVGQSKQKVFVFIDEIQRLKEPGLFLKGFYDMGLPVKFVVSGSSSLEIKSKIQEPLTGRKIVFQLSPFNIKELAAALCPGKIPSATLKDKALFRNIFNHFIVFGGYPAVALEKNMKIKAEKLSEIFHSYLEKDIKQFLKVENENAFMRLVNILSSQIGGIINREELSNSLGIHKNTLENYLYYLEQTFIISFVRPFFRNRRKELLKNPKIYFHDLGIRNTAIHGLQEYEIRPDKGQLLENFCFLQLKYLLHRNEQINFWRTKAGAEMDFVISSGSKYIPIEAKAANPKDYKISRSFRNFIGSYPVERAYFLNLGISGRKTIDSTNIHFITPYDLASMKKI